MLDKEYIKELYLKGYNAVEISSKMQSEVEAVRKCIQRNFESLKHKHDIAEERRI